MGLHYHTYMGNDLENRKILTLVRMVNCVGMNNKNIVDNVGIFNDNIAINNISKE